MPDLPEDEAYCPVCNRTGECAPDCPDRGYAEFMERWEKQMRETVKPKGLEVEVEEGDEGPHWDPYAYHDFRVKMPDGRMIRYKTGMVEELWAGTAERWRDLPEVMRGGGWGSGDRSVRDEFERLVGFSVDQLEWWADEPYRGVPCMACGREGCKGRCQE